MMLYKKIIKVIIINIMFFCLISCGENTNDQEKYYLNVKNDNIELSVGDEVSLHDLGIIDYFGTLTYEYNLIEGIIVINEGIIKGLKDGSTEVEIGIEENPLLKKIIKVKCEKRVTEHIHNFEKKIVLDKYLYKEADYDFPAQYYKSCICGEGSTSIDDLFFYGEKLIREYRISFDLDGGKCEELKDNLIKFKENEKVNLLIPEKLSYEFLGWYEYDKLEEKYIKIDIIENRDYTLVAKWKKTKVIVSLDVNGGIIEGETELNDIKYLYDFNSDVKLPLPKREGYAFMGWSETKYGAWIDKYTHNKVKYHTGEEDVKLYALWISDEYKHYCIEDTFENNPWHHIYYVSNLDELMNLPNNGYVYLENDINVRNKEWQPLGTIDDPYQGYFDGCGHTIRNIKINSDRNEVGFFGVTEGYVYNLNLTNITINSLTAESDCYIGTLFGIHTKGKIYNVNIKNTQIYAKTGIIAGLGGKSYGECEKVFIEGTLNLKGFSGNASGFIGEKSVHSVNNPDASKVLMCKSNINVMVDETTNGSLSALYHKVFNKVSTVETKVEMTVEGEHNFSICGFSNEIINCNIKDSYIVLNNNISYGFALKSHESKFENCYIEINAEQSLEEGKFFDEIINTTIYNCVSNISLDGELQDYQITILKENDDFENKVYIELSFNKEIWVIKDDKLMFKWEE